MAETYELPMHSQQENETTATNVYDDIWRLEREGQGIFKVTEAEIEELAELAVGDD